MIRKIVFAALLFSGLVLAQYTPPGGGGVGIGASNVTASCAGTVTSCAVNVTTLGLTSATFDTAITKCYVISTGAELTLTGNTPSGGPPYTTFTPTFSSTTGVYCTVNSNGGQGAAGAAGTGFSPATSTTSNTIGTGTQTFTVQSGLGFQAGGLATAFVTASPTVNWMTGSITSYSGTTLVISVPSTGTNWTGGSGTYAAWTIAPGAYPGQNGASGACGNAATFNNSGSGGASGATFNCSAPVTISRNTIGAAASGANSDITSLAGLTTPLSVAQGGTGTASPALVAGTNVTITGSWPDQTISATGSGGTSAVFAGSQSPAPAFSATPTFSLAAVSNQSPTRIEPGVMTANVTAVTFSNIPTQGGAKFSIAWTQAASGGPYTVTYGGSTTGAICQVSPTASIVTTQEFEIGNDGSTVKGTGCTTTETGVSRGPTAAAPGTPGSGWASWFDSTDLDAEWKNTAGNIYKAFLAGGDCNPVTGVCAGGTHLTGVPTTAIAVPQGNGTKVQLSTGSTTTNDCVKFDANGNTVDAGSACGSGGGAPTFPVNPQTATYQVLAADFSSCKNITVASGTFTITLVASGSQPAAGQCIWVTNYGSGTITVARSGQNINGGTSSLSLTAGTAVNPTGAFIDSDGTNYFADVFGEVSGTSGVSAFSGDGTLLSNSSSTGAVTATLANAGAHKYWGNNTGSTAAPGYDSIAAADLPAALSSSTSINGVTAPTAAGAAVIGQRIFAGTITLATNSISSTACQSVTDGSVNSVTASGVAATDVVVLTPNGSIKGITGFVPATTGGLTIAAYPKSGYVDVDVCNWSTGSLTPGAVTLNVAVFR